MIFDRYKIFMGLHKALNTKFSQTQVEVVEAIVGEFERRKLPDVRWLAYMLATAWGECTFKPIAEYGKGKGKIYGKVINGQVYYGRGLVQLTWEDNYAKFAKLLNLPLLKQPDLALQPDVAVAILFKGMLEGLFAADKAGQRHSLSRYFNTTTNDPVNARRIINGVDKAAAFASRHGQILAVLQGAVMQEQVQAPVVGVPAPVPVPAPVVPAPVTVPAPVVAAPVPAPVPDIPQISVDVAPAEDNGRQIILTLVGIAAAIGAGLLVYAAKFIGD